MGGGRMMLTDRRMGYVAQRIHRRVGRSTIGLARDALAQAGRLERALAFGVRVPQGLFLETGSGRVPISFDQRGWILIHSSDSSITLQRSPHGRLHVLDITSAIGQGCTEAIKTTIDHAATEKDATECEAVIQFVDGNGYICILHAGDSTGQLQKLETHWCAPTGDPPTSPDEPQWSWDDPDGWWEVALGDECGGQCATKLVPYWDPAS